MSGKRATKSTQAGKYGESVARRYLETLGFEILDANWRCSLGEIDLITRTSDVLVFVEVKLRRDNALTSPEEAVDTRKQAKLIDLAVIYLSEQADLDVAWRIDVIAVVIDQAGLILSIRHYEDAVRAG